MAREPLTRRSRARSADVEAERVRSAEERAERAERELAEVRSRLEGENAQIRERVAGFESELETLRRSTMEELDGMRGQVAAMSAPPAPPAPRAYLLLRSDLPSLGMGKGRAQSMHAGNAMTWALVVEPMLKGEAPDDDVMAWHREGVGFGTAISLGGPGDVTSKVLSGIMDVAGMCGMRVGQIVDDTYPYVVDDEVAKLIDPSIHTDAPRRIRDGWLCCRREVTGMWLFGTKSRLDPLLARFDLTPDA